MASDIQKVEQHLESVWKCSRDEVPQNCDEGPPLVYCQMSVEVQGIVKKIGAGSPKRSATAETG